MANLYVNSVAGSNTAPYDTWAKGAVLLATAATASAAGDDIWVASDHAESSAGAVTITFPGTFAAPNRCMSVNRAGTAPPVAADILAGGSVTTTGANAISLAGSAYIYGLTFNVGSGAVSANANIANGSSDYMILDTCAVKLVATANGNRILGSSGGASCATDFINTTVSFGAAAQGMQVGGPFRWLNKPGSTAITGATLPTTLLVATSSNRYTVDWDGLDLSVLGSGKTLVAAHSSRFNITNCKLGASVTIATTPTNANSYGTRVIGSHSSTLVERNEIYTYQGTLTTETTIIRTAGATDGTTPYSWKIVTTANSKRTFPFETFEGAFWNTSLTSKTLTLYCVTDNVTLQDADIWVEVEYLASGATPVTTLITSANATVLTTAANLTTTTEAWTTTGLVTPVKQKFAVTFTPAMVGPIRWKVKVAKATTTVYVCPVIPGTDFV